MSYTPPAGNAVDFATAGAAYTPPAGNAVVFSSYDEVVIAERSLTATGAIGLGGKAKLFYGEYRILDAAGAIGLGGGASLLFYEQRSLTASGAVSVSGSANLTAFARWGGSVVLGGAAVLASGRSLRAIARVTVSGGATLNLGRALHARGAVRLGGRAKLGVGTVFYAHGNVALRGGAMQLRRGERITVSGGVALGGEIALTTHPLASLSVSGGIRLGGYFVASVPGRRFEPSLAILTRPAEVLHVVG